MNERRNLPQLRPVPSELAAPSLYHVPVQDEPSGQSPLHLREYLSVVLKYRLLVAATVVCSLLIAVGYAFTVAPRYTAESRIRISTYEPVLTATKIEDLLQQKSKESNYLETQVEELRSFSLADRVLEEPQLYERFSELSRGFFSRIFGRSEDTGDDLSGSTAGEYRATLPILEAYLDRVSIRPIRRTALVEISAIAEQPEMAALMANRHAESYIEWVRKTRVDQQSRGLAFLQGQAEELQQKTSDLEREMADYAEANSIVAVNKDENITAQKMSQLSRMMTELTAKRITAEKAAAEAEASLTSRIAIFDDNSTEEMRTELAKLEGELGQLKAKFTSAYPRVKELESRVADLRRSIQNQRKELAAGLRGKANAAREEEESLRRELDQQTSKAFELSKREVYYNQLDRELGTSREMLASVLKQIKETALTIESNSSNVSIVDRAVIPTSPTYPRKSLVLLMGLLIGAVGGIGVAFLMNYLDDTIRTPDQVTQVLRLPVLGVVPTFLLEAGKAQPSSAARPNRWTLESLESAGSDSLPAVRGSATLPAIAFFEDPKSLAAEAYRSIRTSILLSQAGQPPKTILVSSAQSSEGKTTSSINLAACLASAGGRVVLIDADLRRPSVHSYFHLPMEAVGLVDILTGQAGVADVVHHDVVSRLSVITSGRIPPNPAELLGSAEMATLLDELAAEYDYVVIDTPPVLPVTDAVILSRYVDGVMLVVKGATTPRKVIADAKRRLQAVGARFLGAILNDVNVHGGDYQYYNRYYYSYYKHEGAVAAGQKGKEGWGDKVAGLMN